MTDADRRPKRDYKTVAVAPFGEGFAVLFDSRETVTPGGAQLAAPTRALAEAVAAEWRAQGEIVDPKVMKLTAILCAVIDGGGDAADVWREEIMNYLGADLLCCRAEGPERLTERQRAAWDPYLDWLRREFGAELVVTAGVGAVRQPDAALAAIRGVLKDQSPHVVFALKSATALAGSAVLALALWRRSFAPAEIFEASRLDERYQAENWGVDGQAKSKEEAMREDFLAFARFLALLDS